MTNPTKVHQINTLEDLLDNDYNLTAFTSLTDIFQPNENFSNVNLIQKRLYVRQVIAPLDDLDRLGQLLKNSKNAAMSMKFK